MHAQRLRPGRRAPPGPAAGCRRCRRSGTSGGATSARASTVSRVVPGISLTIDRSSCSSRLSSDDLPTFGRPTIATAVSSGRRPALPASRARRASRATISSSRSPTPVAVLGGDLDDRLEPELIELDRPPARPLVVGLVDRHQHRHARPCRSARGDLLVAGHQPFPAVDDEHDDVRGVERPPAVLDDQLVQRILAGAEHPAGVDERERDSLPLGRLRDRRRASSRQSA